MYTRIRGKLGGRGDEQQIKSKADHDEKRQQKSEDLGSFMHICSII